MKSFSLIIISLFGFFSFRAQDKIPYENCDDVFKEAVNLWGAESYHDAYKKMCEINENDTCFIRSLVNRTYYLLNDPDLDDDFKYHEVIRLTQVGIDSDKASSKYFHYYNQIAAYNNLKQYDNALEIIDKALIKYPKNAELFYTRGLTYEYQEKYQEAVEAYQQSLSYNPFYFNAHLKLGVLCMRSKKIAQALMCIDMYLTVNPDGAGSADILNAINKAVSSKFDEEEIEVEISADDDAFEELNLLINNKIALQKKYKIKNKVNIAFMRQNHLMLDQLKSFEGNGGFFDEKYVPFFRAINDDRKFDDFIYTTCYSIENPLYSKIVKGKTADVKSFVVYALGKTAEIYRENLVEIDGNKEMMGFDFTYTGLSGIGKFKNDKPVGPWKIYDGKLQYLKGEGEFDAKGLKHGEWNWYYENGNLESVMNFNHGKLDGEYKQFFSGGKLDYTVEYNNGKVSGMYYGYNNRGALIQQKKFANNKLNGEYVGYYDVGESFPSVKLNYSNGELVGDITEYYINKQISMTAHFVDGKRQGKEKDYYANGQLSGEFDYVNGELDGDYKEYYPDGNIMTEAKFSQGKNMGVWTSFYHNGNKKLVSNYANGKLDGENFEYDLDGKLINKYIYRKGDIIEIYFYNKAGDEIYADRKKKGVLNYKGYNPYGTRLAEGLYDIDGGKEGLWKYYTNDGVLRLTEEYKNGKLNGKSISFYPSGQENRVSIYFQDTLDGYYFEKFPSEDLSEQGWYAKGKAQGSYITYSINGTESEYSYFQNGAVNGCQVDFTFDGDTAVVTEYDLGKIISTTFYNHNGGINKKYTRSFEPESTTNYFFENGEKRATYSMKYGILHGPAKIYYPGGKLRAEGEYLNGYKNGKWTWYHENGQVDTEYTYVVGKLDGKRTDYYEDGKISDESVYIMGKLQGENKSYNEDGILDGIINYEYGQKHGNRYFYSPEGKLQLIRVYSNDQLIGYSYLGKDGKEVPVIPIENETVDLVAYFDNGKISRQMTIDHGLFQGEYKAFYYSGQLESINHYQGDSKEGETISYYADGKVKSVKPYLHDHLHGTVKEYFANGKLKSEVEYQYGEQHGKEIKYDKNGKEISKRIFAYDRFIGY